MYHIIWYTVVKDSVVGDFMKSNFFKKVLYEKTFEINDSVEGAIAKLRQLDERGELVENVRLVFYCTKRGKITVTNYNPPGGNLSGITNTLNVDITGKIVCENGKTVLKAHAIYHRWIMPLVVLVSTLGFIFLATVFCVALFNMSLSDFIIFPIFAFLSFSVPIISISAKQNKRVIFLEKMEEEITRRIKIINLWDK